MVHFSVFALEPLGDGDGGPLAGNWNDLHGVGQPFGARQAEP